MVRATDFGCGLRPDVAPHANVGSARARAAERKVPMSRAVHQQRHVNGLLVASQGGCWVTGDIGPCAVSQFGTALLHTYDSASMPPLGIRSPDTRKVGASDVCQGRRLVIYRIRTVAVLTFRTLRSKTSPVVPVRFRAIMDATGVPAI